MRTRGPGCLVAGQADQDRDPLGDFLDQLDEHVALRGLRVEQFVVTQRNRVLGQDREAIAIERNRDPRCLDDFKRSMSWIALCRTPLAASRP